MLLFLEGAIIVIFLMDLAFRNQYYYYELFFFKLNFTPNEWINLSYKALDSYKLYEAYEYSIFPLEWLLLENILNSKSH